MRLVVTCGYCTLLLPKTANAIAVVEALSEAELVEETGPWDHRVYKTAERGEITTKFIADDDVRLPDAARPPELDKLLEIAKQRDEALVKVTTLEQKLKKVEEAAGAAKA